MSVRADAEKDLPRWASMLVDRYCRRLEGLIGFRLDPRLRGRLSLAELTEEIEQHLRQHVGKLQLTNDWELFSWLRCTSLRLLDAFQREFLGPHYAESLQPALLHLDCLPPVSVQRLAKSLAGTAASQKGMGTHHLPFMALQEAFNRLCRADREILAMRHFEQLTRDELSTALRLSICRTSGHYLAAVRRLRCELDRLGRFFGPSPFQMAPPAAGAVG